MKAWSDERAEVWADHGDYLRKRAKENPVIDESGGVQELWEAQGGREGKVGCSTVAPPFAADASLESSPARRALRRLFSMLGFVFGVWLVFCWALWVLGVSL